MVSSRINYGRWRAISLTAVYLLMGVHIAHWKLTGTTLAPLELNEVLYTLHLGIITAGFLFMGLTMLATLVFGRFFCSWMCHILALQDASAWLLAKMKIKPRFIRSRLFLWLPVIAMGYMFVLPQIERLYKGLPAVSLRMQTDAEGWASFVTNDFWRNLPGIGVTLATFFVAGFAIVYLLGTRSFCQYVCPYGVLFAAADRLAPGKIKLTGDCNQCGECTKACSSHIMVHQEIDRFGKVVDHNCLKDLDCVEACPKDALSFGFTKPSGFKSLLSLRDVRLRYDYTLGEDIAMILLSVGFIFIFFGLYDTIPFLLAVPLAAIAAFFVLKFKQLLSVEYVTLADMKLKRSGKYTWQGKVFMAVFMVSMIFSAHSTFIRYHQITGESAYRNIAAVLHGKESGLSEAEINGGIETAFRHLNNTDRFGLYSSPALLRQLAAISIYKKDNKNAAKYLEDMIEKLPDDTEARLRYAKLMIVNGQNEKAHPQLQYIALQDAYTPSEKQWKSDALVTLGHLQEQSGFADEAIRFYNEAIEQNANNGDAWLASGVLLTRTGNLQKAYDHLVRASSFYSQSPLIENNLAVICLQQRNHSEAKLHLENLLKLQHDNVQAAYNLSMVNYALGNTSEAVSTLQKILDTHPEHQNALNALRLIESKSIKPSKKTHS